jgi:hypothetical protein
MARRVFLGSKSKGRAVAFGSALALLLPAAPASAQLSRIGSSTIATFAASGLVVRGTDSAYDPVSQLYLIVSDLGGNAGIYGTFVNTSGAPATGTFTISDGSAGFGSFPRVAYSPDVSNAAGGFGGFLVTWNQYNGHNDIFGRIVAVAAPGRLVSGVQQFSNGEQGGSYQEAGPAMAYSRTAHRFLVAWQTPQYGIVGRFVGLSGAPSGGAMALENIGGSRDPALAWNPATDEFGLVYSGWSNTGAFVSFRRVRAADGLISGRTSFGFTGGTFATGIGVNAANQYVMGWAVGPGTRTATFDQNGSQLTTNFVTDRFGYNQSLGLGYNAASGTFLVVSSDSQSLEVAAIELAGSGAPNSSTSIITDGATQNGGSFYPRTTQHVGAKQWDVVYSRNYQAATNQIVATSSTGGGSGATAGGSTGGTTTTGCSTPDPFASLGGGTCVNGGWLPPGSGSTSTSTGGCTSTQPASDWVCVNGGWVPPTTTSSGSGCSTPDPFLSIGGGTCVNGGWIPGTSGTSTSGCSTPDPFASIGGGSCVNGGWVPKTSTASSSCSTADPFASIGGGVCINGGWVPKGVEP